MVPHLVLLALVSGATLFAGLGRPAIADTDEAFYAEAAREMLETGDWVTPQYNYQPRFQKPILYYWLAGLTYRLGGVNEAAARFPAAVSGLGLVLLAYFVGRRAYDAATGLLAGGIVATSVGGFYMARQALPDLPLAFFVSLATWSGMRVWLDTAHTEEGRPARSSRVGLSVAAGAAAAGVLTKGPLGVLLPCLVLLPALAVDRWVAGPRRARSTPSALRWADVAFAVAIFVVLVVPWYAAMAWRHGVAYLYGFFVGENVERYATEEVFGPSRPVWFYLPVLLGGLLPWSPFMGLWVPALVRWLRSRRTPERVEWGLLLWSGMPLLFFSGAAYKQARYVLPLLVPLAVLLARTVRARQGDPLRGGNAGQRDRGLALCGTLAGATLVMGGVLLWRMSALLEPIGAPALALGVVTLGLCGSGVIAVAWLGRPRMVGAALVAAAAMSLLTVQYSVLALPDPEPVERVAAPIRAHYKPGDLSARYRVFVRNLIFYTRVPQVDLFSDEQVAWLLRRDERAFCVLPAEDVERIEAVSGLRLRRLAEVPYVNTLNLTLRTIFAPDPARDLKRVVVVLNR